MQTFTTVHKQVLPSQAKIQKFLVAKIMKTAVIGRWDDDDCNDWCDEQVENKKIHEGTEHTHFTSFLEGLLTII